MNFATPLRFRKNSINGVKVFHAGTKIDSKNNIVSNGGRVLSVTANAKNMEEARILAYKAINKIDWDDGFYRNDILIETSF